MGRSGSVTRKQQEPPAASSHAAGPTQGGRQGLSVRLTGLLCPRFHGCCGGSRTHGGGHQLLKLPHEADSHRLLHFTDQISVRLSPNFEAGSRGGVRSYLCPGRREPRKAGAGLAWPPLTQPQSTSWSGRFRRGRCGSYEAPVALCRCTNAFKWKLPLPQLLSA